LAVRVLLIEDSQRVADAISAALRERSLNVTVAGTVRAAEEAFGAHKFDIAVVDIGLPDGSGLSWCKSARSAGCQIPILLLTARNSVEDRVAGLEAGADDYMGKPFSIEELVARLRALSRRGPRWSQSVRTFGPVLVDLDRRLVTVNGERLALTARELDIVAVLAWRDGRVVPRDEILETIWGAVSESAAASLEVLVARVRRKLAERGARDAVRTVRQVGYAWTIEPSKPD
jgi:DNA-binding response OmpR family regulator